MTRFLRRLFFRDGKGWWTFQLGDVWLSVQQVLSSDDWRDDSVTMVRNGDIVALGNAFFFRKGKGEAAQRWAFLFARDYTEERSLERTRRWLRRHGRVFTSARDQTPS